MAKPKRLKIEGANLLPGAFKNFRGEVRKFNKNGERSFCVLIEDPEVEKELKRDGWYVRYTRPRDEDDVERAYLQVKVKFGKRPPTVALITSQGRLDLDEDAIEILDWIEYENVDMFINPFEYDIDGNQGVAAYLHSIFVTQSEDDLDRKYADVPRVSGDVGDEF